MAVKQTAGRTQLGDFAPKFAELNDDVLFGEVWAREDKLGGRKRGLYFVWQKKFGMRKLLQRTRKQNMKNL